jgi:hypothetical protein
MYLSRECYIVNVLDFKAESISKHFGETVSKKYAHLEQWKREVREHTHLLQKAANLDILPSRLLSFLVATMNGQWQKEQDSNGYVFLNKLNL